MDIPTQLTCMPPDAQSHATRSACRTCDLELQTWLKDDPSACLVIQRIYEPRTIRLRRGSAGGGHGQSRGGAAYDDEEDASDGELAALREETRRQGRGEEGQGRRRTSKFSSEQQARLVELFEEHGLARQGYLEAIQAGVGGSFSAGQVRRELKALGLRRGQPTERQVGVPRACRGQAAAVACSAHVTSRMPAFAVLAASSMQQTLSGTLSSPRIQLDLGKLEPVAVNCAMSITF